MKKIVVHVDFEQQYEDADYDEIIGYMSKDAYADYLIKAMMETEPASVKASITFDDGTTVSREAKN